MSRLKTILGLVALLLLGAGKAASGEAGGHALSRRTLWLRHLHRGDELRLRPFRAHGQLTRKERRALARFLRSRMGERRPVRSRLVAVLVQLSRTFDGRPITVMSGFRKKAQGDALRSYHQVGRAVDLSIEGVPDREVFEHCRLFQAEGLALGCGLYPNGRHVHVDVRSRKTIWVDLSGYHDGARYVRDPEAWLAAHPEAGRARNGRHSAASDVETND